MILSSRNKKFILGALLLLSLLISLNPQVRSSADETEVGFEFEGSQQLNLTTVVAKEYVGDCPGFERGMAKAYFIDTTTPPAAYYEL